MSSTFSCSWLFIPSGLDNTCYALNVYGNADCLFPVGWTIRVMLSMCMTTLIVYSQWVGQYVLCSQWVWQRMVIM